MEHKFLKWARMTHLDTLNKSYGQKKGWKSNWQFDSRPLKVTNHPDSLVCKWHATCRWKAIDEGYNFSLNFISIKGLYKKLCDPKVVGVLVGEFRDSHLGVPGQNDIWVLVPWPCMEYTLRGKVVASPKSRLR